MNVLLAQFENIKPNDRSFNKYLRNVIKKQKVDIVVIGEGVCNLFFKEYKNNQVELLDNNFIEQKKYFSILVDKYKVTFVVPLIECRDNKLYKVILIIGVNFKVVYDVQQLINMKHWNERSFYSNKQTFKMPFAFNQNGFNISVITGWEAHFDDFWVKIKKNNIDIVIIPTQSTFNSNDRWARLMQTRSFLNSCFVIRVNRVGSYMEDAIEWKFYGNSFIALPDGSIGDILDSKEGVLVSKIDKELLHIELDKWHFR